MIIEDEIAKFPYWYHRIELAPGVVTPGLPMEPLWDHLRKIRNRVDYRDKTVLDICAFDGMFAFEAEKKGAKSVVATDCLYGSFKNFMFCRDVLRSKVVPYFNVSPYNLTERLDVYFDEQYPPQDVDRRFDIVQHLGLLYHLRDPMYSLSQARSVLKTGGKLIIETDAVLFAEGSFMVFNGLPKTVRVRDNVTVWWAPTKRCLFEMLEASLFEVDEKSYSEFIYETPQRAAGRVSDDGANSYLSRVIGRAAVVATAVVGRGDKFEAELQRTYRNPGLDFNRMELSLWK